MKSSNDKRTRWSQLTPGTPVEIVFKPLTDSVWHQELGGGCTELTVQDCVGGDVSSYMVRQISLQHALKMRVTEGKLDVVRASG